VVFRSVAEKYLDGLFALSELEKKHNRFADYWDQHGWEFCSMTFLEWIDNGMPREPPEAHEPRNKPGISPHSGIPIYKTPDWTKDRQ
jgi:hypothetical protein